MTDTNQPLNASDVQRIAAEHDFLKNYSQTWTTQAISGFNWALGAAGVGLLFIVGAIVVAAASGSAFPVWLAVTGAALSELIAGILFWSCRKAAWQVNPCHERLHQLQRYLLADAICEELDVETKASARYNLVAAIANFPSSPRVCEKSKSTGEGFRNRPV